MLFCQWCIGLSSKIYSFVCLFIWQYPTSSMTSDIANTKHQNKQNSSNKCFTDQGSCCSWVFHVTMCILSIFTLLWFFVRGCPRSYRCQDVRKNGLTIKWELRMEWNAVLFHSGHVSLVAAHPSFLISRLFPLMTATKWLNYSLACCVTLSNNFHFNVWAFFPST